MHIVDLLDASTYENENPYALLCDDGSFFQFPARKSTSAWDGLYFFDAKTVTAHKVLHAVVTNKQPHELRVGTNTCVRVSDHLSERFRMGDGVWTYAARGEAQISLLLDIRAADDYDTHGRFHGVERIDEHLYLLHGKDGQYVLRSTHELAIVDEWTPMDTSYDHRRQGSDQWWVHRRLRIRIDGDARIVIGRDRSAVDAAFGQDVQEQVDLVEDALRIRAQRSLSELLVGTSMGPAVLAGYPWFTQVWTRDEAISLGGFLLLGRSDAVAQILMRQLGRIDEHGRISNRTPGSDLGSADGIGWVVARLHDLFTFDSDSLTHEQWRFCYDQLCLSLDRLFEHHVRDGLVHNDPKETWMDTEGSTDDVRDGACIEIQALTLRMLRCAADLAQLFDENPSWWEEKERELRERVRSEFLHEGVLSDRAGDPTQRPNLFIAAYVYEDLCSSEEWKGIFSHALDALWLDWGALSTIDTSHDLFLDVHTGMHDDSYHRGDTWYWINLLAAVVLSRIGEFSDHVDALIASARRDTQELGVVGHPSEISSAREQEALGCWSQAWSAAMLLEALTSCQRRLSSPEERSAN